eukprot:m.29232 g.29232  ORF g.29232 m.29232 type:complete len:783 (+) comp31151_c0_seq2:745-3093(+)
MPSRKEDQTATEKSSSGKRSWLPSFRKSKAKPPDDSKREQQHQAYVSWVNSHLRKKPGCRLVEDLKRDMTDGITLISLVEILSGQALVDIERAPMTQAAKRENIERVLKYMTSKKIRMHHTTAKDVLEGNLKSIMRLILALAAFFNTRAAPVAQPQAESPAPSPLNSSLIYANPTAKSSPRPGHGNPFSQYAKNGRQSGNSFDAEAFRPRLSPPAPPSAIRRSTLPGGGGVRITRAKDRFREVDLESSICSSVGFGPVRTSSPQKASNPRRLSELFNWPSPDVNTSTGGGSSFSSARKRRSGISKISPEKISRTRKRLPSHGLSVVDGSRNDTRQTISEEGNDENVKDENLSEIERELKVATQAVIDGLGELAVGGDKADDESRGVSNDDDDISDSELMPILLEQRDFVENQLGKTKGLLYGLQHLLLSGMAPENASIPSDETELRDTLTLSNAEKDQLRQRADALEIELKHAQKRVDELEKDNKALENTADDRELEVDSLRADLLRYTLSQKTEDNEKDGFQAELNEAKESSEEAKVQLKIRDTMIDQLQKQLDEATRRIVELNSRNEAMESQMEKRGCHIKELQSKLTRVLVQNGMHGEADDFHSTKSLKAIHKDIEAAQAEVRKLKTSLMNSKAEPLHCISANSLELSLRALIDKVDALGSPQNGRHARPQSVGSFSDRMRRKRGSCSSTSPDITASTKVVYFTERAVTPYLTTIPKSLGDIYLRDFKEVFDRPGTFRYHFKTIDSEYGAVKQELNRNDDVIPGWEGRIVVWVEEDTYV